MSGVDILTTTYLLARGMMNNICLWFIAGTLSLCGGILLGSLSNNSMRRQWLAHLIYLYVVIMRSIPLYVHILYVYFVAPYLIGINLSPWTAALVALVLCVTAYVTEVIRGALNAIAHGQWEVATLLGYTYWQALRYILLPQALQRSLPSLLNLSEELIKGTAIVSTVGVMDVTRTGMNIIARTMNPELVYTLITLLYVVISLCVHALLLKLTRGYYETA